MMPTNPSRFEDAQARERIRTSLDESLIVEAAAGTGKTSELIQRIVALLENGRTTVEHLVAVTFTRKAAGELKLRLRKELDRALYEARRERAPAPGAAAAERRNGAPIMAVGGHPARPRSAAKTTHPSSLQLFEEEPQESVCSNLEKAIAHLEEAHVGTIHSFCGEILRERPVEANIDPAFQELSESGARRLYRRAFRTWIQEKLDESPPGLRRALSRLALQESRDEHSPLGKLDAAGWKLVEWRDFPGPWRRPPFQREQQADRLADQALQLATLTSKCQNPKDNLYVDLRPVLDLAARLQRVEESVSRDYDALEALLLKLLADLKRGRKRKGTGTFAPGVPREDVVQAREVLLHALQHFRREADADLAALLQSEMRGLVNRYEELKRSTGGLDFSDLLLKVRDLFRDNAEVRNYFQDQFTHIFVDEFQDTEPIQLELLLLLSANDPAETNWLRVKPIPGKLFLVGDPKQSIYRFRRADVVLYQKIRDGLVSRGVGLVFLTKSFRAVRPIQECINAAFEPEMTGNATVGQAAYIPLEEVRKSSRDQPCVIALPVPQPYGGRGRVTAIAVEKSMPDGVAAFIDWLIRESGWKIHDPGGSTEPGATGEAEQHIPISPRHISILFRRFVSWGEDVTRDYLRALEAHDIPHLLVGSRSFHSREEVETLRAALTAVEWPDDELSVFAVLKGSLFGIPDSTLLRFMLEVGALHPFRPVPQNLPVDFRPLAEGLGLMADLHRQRNWRPIVETINALLGATRAHAGFAFRAAGNQVLANVHRVLDLARSFELGGGISFRGFVEELGEETEREEGGTPVFEEAAEGVRIMTVHGAKGLEFPVVILADPTTQLSRADPEKHVDASQDLCAMRVVDCAPHDLQDHEREEAERDRAEGVRVAYVAATRARDLLVVAAVGEPPVEGWWLSPLYKAIYPARALLRQSQLAPGCPALGDATALEAYGDDQLLESVVKPGLHRAERGTHSVVWWDPKALKLGVEPNFGLRQEELLMENQGSEAAAESIRRYEEWKAQRERVREGGQRPEFKVLAVSETTEPPADFQSPVAIELREKPANRPQGPRFGTLVHGILRDVDFGVRPDRRPVESREDLTSLAQVHGRVLGATPEEVAAAAQAVAAILEHPLLERARSARACHRELPVMVKANDGQLIEGNLDLAFLDNGAWTIVDFKTDVDLPLRQTQYERQLKWYAFALSKTTGTPARGWLLGV